MKRQHTTPTAVIQRDLKADLGKIKSLLDELVASEVIEKEGAYMEAFSTIETFCAIAVRVIAKTNPSKVRDEARTVEIQHLMKPT